MIISEKSDCISVNRAADLLDASRSGYYRWRDKSHGPEEEENSDVAIKEEMQKIVIEFPGYGYRRVKVELWNRNHVVNQKKVRRLMKEDNLICVKKRFKLQTTDSNHGEKIYPNLAKTLEVTEINQLWVADITYIQLSKEFVYLAVIIDVFSRRCIGWDLSRNIDTQLTLNALLKALQTRNKDDLKNLHMSSVKKKFDSSIWNKLCYGHGCWIEEIVFIKSKGTRMTRIRRIFTDLRGSDSDVSFC